MSQNTNYFINDNGTYLDISNLFQQGSSSTVTRFYVGGQDIGSLFNIYSTGTKANITNLYFNGSDLANNFSKKSTISFTTPADTGTYSNNYNSGTNKTVLSFTTVQSTTITFTNDMTISYLVVAGGGGGGTSLGKGGNGGQVLSNASYTITKNTPYTITVGGGGTGSSTANVSGGAGGNSVFGAFSATGGSGGTSVSKSKSTTPYTVHLPPIHPLDYPSGNNGNYDNNSWSSKDNNGGAVFSYNSGSYLITFDQAVTDTEARFDFLYIRNGDTGVTNNPSIYPDTNTSRPYAGGIGQDVTTRKSGRKNTGVWNPLTVTSSNGIYFLYTMDSSIGFYGIKLTLTDGATYFSENGGNNYSTTGGTGTSTQGGNGAAGVSNSITGSSVTYGGGGGGSIAVYGTQTPVASSGGTGGGGNGAYYKNNGGSISSVPATAGTANTGGGGGGGDFNNSSVITAGGNGGSGIVIISFIGI